MIGFLHWPLWALALFMLWHPSFRAWQMRHVVRDSARRDGLNFARGMIFTFLIGCTFAAALSLPAYLAGMWLADLVHFRISN